MLDRRELLKRLAATTMACSLPGLTFGRADTDARFVLVILRGAMDGLAFAPPYGDKDYARTRGALALAAPGTDDGALKLDNLFGLHPSFKAVHDMYRHGEATLLHAVASPYRERSHFDGQDVLENGALKAGDLRDGWLNRALASLGGSLGNERAIALSQSTPLVLRGAQSVTSWAPSAMPDANEDTLQRLADLYADDEFFRVRLQQALEAQAIAGDSDGMGRTRGNDAVRFEASMRQAARFLSAGNGPQIAVLESGGWDTHANQGTAAGSLANRFTGLDTGLATLKNELGDTWKNTVVVVATEFGRTVAVNGTRGTDHGTASAALLAGGSVRGGRVIADWPGLSSSALYEGRDLYPTTDLRSLFKAVLTEHLGVPAERVEAEVFPDSGSAQPLENLLS